MSNDLLPFIKLHMRKMSSYHWFGVWMMPDGSAMTQPFVDEHHVLVGEIRGHRRDEAETQILQQLWEGGFRPGDLPSKAWEILGTVKPT